MNYSLLVMESAGMIKMATGEGPPPPAGCRNRVPIGFWWLQRLAAVELPIYSVPRRFYGIWTYIGVRSRSVELRGAHEGGGAPRGQARLPALWPPRSFPDFNSKSPGSRPFQKSHSRRFHSVWTPFDIPFLRNTETRKKNRNWHWAMVNS